MTLTIVVKAAIERAMTTAVLLVCCGIALSGCSPNAGTTMRRDTFTDHPPAPRSIWVLEEQ
jgi:hypothetical protein